MVRNKLIELLKVLKQEIAKAEVNARKTKKSADEIARSAAASPSQSGDREHSQQQALINADRLARLVNLENGIKSELNKVES